MSGSDTPGATGAAPVTGSVAPTFTAETLSGRSVRFPQDFAGRLVLLDFWATWCGPCRKEIPAVVAVHERFGTKGLVVLGVTLDGPAVPAARVREFVRDQKMPWEQVYADAAAIAQQYGVTAIPWAVLVDADTGRIVAHGEELAGPRLAATIERCLNAKRAN